MGRGLQEAADMMVEKEMETYQELLQCAVRRLFPDRQTEISPIFGNPVP